jgi:DNA-directed RNA polymerase subunit M/transcription elongation factor TFIIS
MTSRGIKVKPLKLTKERQADVVVRREEIPEEKKVEKVTYSRNTEDYIKRMGITDEAELYDLMYIDAKNDLNPQELIFSSKDFDTARIKFISEISTETDGFIEGLYVCSKCRGKMQRYLNIQKRSGDEATSTKIICQCGNSWII